MTTSARRRDGAGWRGVPILLLGLAQAEPTPSHAEARGHAAGKKARVTTGSVRYLGAGAAVVKRREYYEVSKCHELQLRPVQSTSGVGVFVDAAASYRPPQVEAWQPDPSAAAALEEMVRVRQASITHLDSATVLPFGRRALFFAWQASGEQYAVVGGTVTSH